MCYFLTVPVKVLKHIHWSKVNPVIATCLNLVDFSDHTVAFSSGNKAGLQRGNASLGTGVRLAFVCDSFPDCEIDLIPPI